MFQLKIHPRKTAVFFLAIVLFLTVLHSIAMTTFLYTGNHDLLDITGYVDFDIEKNIPSLYSAFAIFFCSLLFFCISSLEKDQGARRCYWLVLAAIFFFLSLDEALVLHERLGDYTEYYIQQTGILQASGLLYFPWILPYSILTAILGLFYFRFLLQLPRKTAVLLILSAVIFLTGAAFFDMLGGREAELHGYEGVTYTVLYTIEEFCEMNGIVLLMYTLLDYIEQHFGHLSLSLQVQKT
ncbi:MAG: peptidase M48 Ste24p [Candidatus Electrothrix sp. ATG2]|nr:peptidase M48 Ste24p [Candidatus Electrothrix sp. ATG2]